MPFIAREDGETFVIPSYRDVLSAKKSSVLKKEILLLSENYGGYATLIKKSGQQYEVAFSPDPGYLLGETVWHYFKRPFDLIYCEAIPNTSEAILVIVKSGSVFLDGSFPIDSIPEELVVFQTQKNNFEVYIYGDVPISQTSEEGKFSFDASQVKSFNVLSEPAFSKLPKVKAFQLQLVNTALKSQGIGVFPVKQMLVVLIAFGLLWMGWTYITSHKKQLPKIVVNAISPYQSYVSALSSPSPYLEIKNIEYRIMQVVSMPGWVPQKLDYSNGVLNISVKSLGATVDVLEGWAKNNYFQLIVKPDGFSLTQTTMLSSRPPPNMISALNDIVISMVDRMGLVLPGNNLNVAVYENKITYYQSKLTITFTNISVNTLDLIAKQFENLPLVLTKVTIDFSNGSLSGTIDLIALGN